MGAEEVGARSVGSHGPDTGSPQGCLVPPVLGPASRKTPNSLRIP